MLIHKDALRMLFRSFSLLLDDLMSKRLFHNPITNIAMGYIEELTNNMLIN